MPPRKKKAGAAGAAGGGAGGALGALGGKKKEKQLEKAPRIMGGLVNTLGWLWRGGKPLPRQPPPREAEDEDEGEPEVPPVRSLPAFVVLHLVGPGSGNDFKAVIEKKNYAVFEVASALKVGEFRVRLRDFFADWQELKPGPKPDEAGGGAAGAAGKAPAKKVEKKSDKKKKGKGGDGKAAPVKLKAPDPMPLITGRRAWANPVRLGAVVSQVGVGGSDSGDGEAWHSRLPWASFGTELFR